MKKNVIIWGVIILIALIAGFFLLNAYIYQEKQGEELPQEQTEALSQEQRETLASAYIEQNISDLSSEPEVLGGTFYTTNIEFTGTNSGTVAYEDGHIALVADFEYSFDEEGNIDVELTNIREDQP